MALKKNELYASLWASCDELRGGMDASLYKDYVLTLLFLKYISDKSGTGPALIELPEGTHFDDIIKLKNTPEIGDNLNKIIAKIAEANFLKGVIDVADFNNEDKLGKGKEMVERLSKLVGIFEGLDLSANGVDDDDLLGDAYEYLMRHFATESGKSKGQFYTPAEVSRIMAKIIGIDPNSSGNVSVYDPTCGSGSLLLKAVSQANHTLSVYGQEKDVATASLAIMNMILHGNETAEIRTGNTLANPAFLDNGQLKTFDFAVANPPFSSKNWTSGLTPQNDPYERFAYGVPPEKNGDYTFLLHLLKSLKSTGKGAIILPHGVLFRGNAESTIRQELLKQGVIKGIIGLPANLFYGTGIPACIIVIDKQHAQIAQFADDDNTKLISGRPIFMIDASFDSIKDGNKNRLREQDIHKIVDTFIHQKELPHYSRLVSLAEIVNQDYNLNLPRYIDTGKADDIQDLEAHLYGGIPADDIDGLAEFWQVFDGLKGELFEFDGKRYHAKKSSDTLKAHILAHPTYQKFVANALTYFKNWQQDNQLRQISPQDKAKHLIEQYSESLLNHFSGSLLLENYAVYQILMDYWADTMQDDVYLILGEGWEVGKALIEVSDSKKSDLTVIFTISQTGKNGKSVDKRITKRYQSPLIPPTLIAKRFFADDLANLTTLQNQLEQASEALKSYLEEHGTENGLFANAFDDKDKITAKSLKSALQSCNDDDEKNAINHALQLLESEKKAKDSLKNASEKLDLAIFNQYGKLNESDIKTLVVEDKWLFDLQSQIQNQIERTIQGFITRLVTLENRYQSPLSVLTDEVAHWETKVNEHLKVMGLL